MPQIEKLEELYDFNESEYFRELKVSKKADRAYATFWVMQLSQRLQILKQLDSALAKEGEE